MCQMKIAIRVDASNKIGTGHFMRCLTLADALKIRGAQVRFVSRHIPEYLQDMLNVRGHELIQLDGIPAELSIDDNSYAHWLGVSQAQDSIDTRHALCDQAWDWLVVDHYALGVRWETVLRDTVKRILVIDDIADRQHDCDLLLDQNLYANMDIRYTGKVPRYCQLLLGPRYALLRDEFRKIRAHVKPRTGPVNRILVFFGGVDPDSYTSHAIEALAEINKKDLYVDVVIGSQHPNREQIKKACAEHNFFCHVQTSLMAELMAVADLAIGAGGSASWERCCLGLPTLIVSLADNQTGIARALDLFSACRYMGSMEAASTSVMRAAIVDLMNHQDHLRALSEKSYSLVDGLGLDRVCQSLGC